jgi:hypothetical protein
MSIALWHAEHVNFATLLNRLEAELERFHKGESPDYELMLDIMFYMTHYPDALHHPKEDLAFARIKERQAGARAIVDELAGQHAQLKETGEALVHVLDEIVNGTITSRARGGAGQGIPLGFPPPHDHRGNGDSPLAVSLLSDDDWAEINAAIQHIDRSAVRQEGGGALRRSVAKSRDLEVFATLFSRRLVRNTCAAVDAGLFRLAAGVHLPREFLLLGQDLGREHGRSGGWRNPFALYSAQTDSAIRARSLLNFSSVEITPRISPMTSFVPALALYQSRAG